MGVGRNGCPSPKDRVGVESVLRQYLRDVRFTLASGPPRVVAARLKSAIRYMMQRSKKGTAWAGIRGSQDPSFQACIQASLRKQGLMRTLQPSIVRIHLIAIENRDGISD